jgi:hypothetical protein
MRAIEPGRMPSDEQTLILKAALLEGQAGREATLRWLPAASLDRLGTSSRRLLPLLYDRLQAEGIEHPMVNVLRGVKRHTWYHNRLLFHQARDVVRSVRQTGIEVMIIKGAALTIEYYRDYGLRPMDDLDLMVPVGKAVEAVAEMQKQGCKLHWQIDLEYMRDHVVDFLWELHLCNAKGRHFDLHWHLYPMCLNRDSDDDLWQASRAARFEGEDVRVPCPADLLLHTIVHGFSWETISPIRWIPDALAILRKAESIEWERLLQQSAKRGLVAMTLPSLLYLQREFAAPVPSEVISTLKNTRVSILQKLEYANGIKPITSFQDVLVSHLCRTARVARGASLRKKLRILTLSHIAYAKFNSRAEIPRRFYAALRRTIGKRVSSESEGAGAL